MSHRLTILRIATGPSGMEMMILRFELKSDLSAWRYKLQHLLQSKHRPRTKANCYFISRFSSECCLWSRDSFNMADKYRIISFCHLFRNMCANRVLYCVILCLFFQETRVLSLHLQGTWRSGDFFKFLAKFGFQKTSEHDKLNTQGYVYGNITTNANYSSELSLVFVDSEYFLHFYGNRSVQPRSNACPVMFKKIETIAWDYTCNPTGHEDFLRRIPCPTGQLCVDEDIPNAPKRVVPGYQFTYVVQEPTQPRLVLFMLHQWITSSPFWENVSVFSSATSVFCLKITL